MQRLHQRPTTGGATSSPLATEAAAAAAVDTSSKADSLLATSASGDRPETTSGYRLECRDLDSSLDSRDCATLTSSSSQQHQHQHQQQTTSGTPIVVQLSQACAAELHATPPQLIRPSPFLPPSAPFASQLAPPHPLSAPSNLTGFVIPQEVYAVGPGNGTTGLLTPVHFLAASGTLSQTNLVYTQPPAQHSFFVHEPASRAFPVHQPLTFQTTEHRHSGDCHYLGLCGVRDRLEHYQNSIGKAGSTGCLPDTSVSPEMHSHGVICRELNELRERLRQFESKMAARDDSSLEVTAAARESSPLGVVRIGDRSELTPNFSTAYTCASRIDLTSTQFV